MILPLVLATVSAQAETPPFKQVAQNFDCRLRTAAGKVIAVSGDYMIRETAPAGRGTIQVRVQSADKAWSFINASTRADFRPGPDWIRVMFDFTDPANEHDGKLGALDDQEYTLDLNFPARILELRGRLGFATIRDKKDDTPLVWEGLPYPIAAIGPCDLAPNKEATA